METLGFASVALVAVVSTLVGARLLWIARRTRGLPEFVLGLSLVGITGVGFPVLLLTELRAQLGPQLTLLADSLGSSFVAAGFAGFYVFTWRVFRPEAYWARGLTAVGCAVMAFAMASTVWLAIGIESNAEKFRAVRVPEIVLFLAAAGGFAWSAVEAFLYHGRLRRRHALGLVEPVVVNRVLLWALTGLVASAALVVMTALRLADVNYLSAPVALLTASGCGLLASGFLYLAFLPPDWYLRRVGRAVATHD